MMAVSGVRSSWLVLASMSSLRRSASRSCSLSSASSAARAAASAALRRSWRLESVATPPTKSTTRTT